MLGNHLIQWKLHNWDITLFHVICCSSAKNWMHNLVFMLDTSWF
jgi:hypothetical protein